MWKISVAAIDGVSLKRVVYKWMSMLSWEPCISRRQCGCLNYFELIQLPLIISSHPSATYMRQWIGSALIQVMACRLFGAKPLPEPMLAYCQLDPQEQTSVKLESKYETFHLWKFTWKCRLLNWRPFCPGGDELMATNTLRLSTRFLLVTRLLS